MLNKALADPSISWLAALEPPERLSSDAMTLVGVDAEGLMSIALRMESGALAYGIGPQPLEPVPASGLRVLRGNARSLTTVYGGGTPRVTHVPLDQPDASYTQYVEGEAPQTIRAAALTSQGELVLLDVDPTLQRRLLLVDFDANRSTLVATFTGSEDHYAMTSTPDGRIALLSWNAQGPGWTLWTFWIRGNGVNRWYEGDGMASGGEMALGTFRGSAIGLTLSVFDETIGWVPFGVPYTSLVDSNGLPNELPGGCGCAVLRSTSMSTRKVFAFVALIALVWVRRGRRRWMPCTMAGYRA